MNFDTIFKAYDIRGEFPEQLSKETAYLLGGATAEYLQAKFIVVGRDMRISGEVLFKELARGITDAGTNVIDIGLVSTDTMYFTVGQYGFEGGIMITASHNPSQYNGFKICRNEAIPLSLNDGLSGIKAIMEKGTFTKSEKIGEIIEKEILDDFVDFVCSFIDIENIRPFNIAIDAGNGMAGKILPPVFDKLPLTIKELYFELDGSFPNHPANPLEPENTKVLRELVANDESMDFGVAFDGDADRMFMIDDKGKLVDSSMVAALVARNLLKKHPGESIIYNIICSKTVRETIASSGGNGILTPVGHALIKPIMRKNNAIFGGEHSGHFYFRDFWFADSGLVTFLIVLEMLSETEKKLSELIYDIDHYSRSGEINTRVADISSKLEEIKTTFTTDEVKPNLLDGVTFDFGDYWFNVRPSNTEPLLRLNLEAKTQTLLEAKVDEVLNIIRA